MARTKKKYYDISNLLKTNAQYMMLLGQRANGKSYQVKLYALKRAYEDGVNFIYLRRHDKDIKQRFVSAYFGDMPIEKITNGNYNGVEAYQGSIYFTYYDEGKKKNVRGEEIGRYCALNVYERYKSQTFVDFDSIIYEEFITDSTYLYDEPRLLQQFVSTVARHSEIKVFLIGNTLTRVCPYFAEWCLDGVLNQKIGTIDVYHFHVGDSVIDIAVEYCANAKIENKMFFGQTAKQIVHGEWDTKDVAKLPKKQDVYETVYEILLTYQKFSFVIQLLVDTEDGGRLVHVYPYTGHRKIYRQLTDTFSDKPNISARLDTKRRPEAIIAECFRQNKICYSDNMTGSDFKNVNNVFRIGQLFS